MVGFLFQEVSLCSPLLPTLFVIGCRGEKKWFKIAGVYPMIFKVPALREEIGDLLDIYIVLTVIIHLPSHFLESVERR